MDIERIKQIGIRAAYQGGEVLNRYFGKLETVNKKGTIDLVTIADIESEKIIIDTIQSSFPDHGILAEESGLLNDLEEDRWIIDPLDGTTNYTHGLGLFAVSIAFMHKGRPIMGIVFNPFTGELFTATKNQGAYLNHKSITVSQTTSVGDSLLVTGFPYNFPSITPTLMKRFTNCLLTAQGIRRLGSAALDLCYVSCGRFDGFWEENLKPWDTAAGLLIVQEAAGKVTDFKDQLYNIDKKQIMATNGYIHAEMQTLLNIKES
jgi:myo-inositol-1(or 4)-monophosphatase